MSENDDIRKRVIELIREYYTDYWRKHAKIEPGEAINLDNALALSLIQEKVELLTHLLDKKTALELLKTIREELRTTPEGLGLTSEEKHRLDNLLSQFP